MKETFSPSQYMTEYVGNSGKLFEVQDSLLKTWIAIRIVGWCGVSNEKVGKNLIIFINDIYIYLWRLIKLN